MKPDNTAYSLCVDGDRVESDVVIDADGHFVRGGALGYVHCVYSDVSDAIKTSL